MSKAFVTGASGQDGSYICELLLSEGWEVDALVRPSGDHRLQRLANCIGTPGFELVRGDVLDPSLPWKVAAERYAAVYHLAGVTQVMQSFQAPGLTMETNTTATTNFLNALFEKSPDTRFYFAATSEMFGGMNPPDAANEDFALGGHSPYAASKIAAFTTAKVYRQRGMFVVNGIGFNHESCRRGENFVTRKVGLGIRRFLETGQRVILGNPSSKRDWHHAKDTMRGAYYAMTHKEPGDYVWSSGKARSIGELVDAVCYHFGVSALNATDFQLQELRPWDVDYLKGDSSKALRVLGWAPKISWDDLIEDICREEGEL